MPMAYSIIDLIIKYKEEQTNNFIAAINSL